MPHQGRRRFVEHDKGPESESIGGCRLPDQAHALSVATHARAAIRIGLAVGSKRETAIHRAACAVFRRRVADAVSTEIAGDAQAVLAGIARPARGIVRIIPGTCIHSFVTGL